MPNFENLPNPNSDGNFINFNQNKLPNLRSSVYGQPDLSSLVNNLDLPPIPALAGFNPSLSVNTLIDDGKLKKADTSDSVDLNGYPSLQPGQAPSIKVEYNNLDKSAQPSPNFIIKENGVVECVRNPEANPPSAQIVIQVERPAKQAGSPNANEQIAIDNMVDYLGQRIESKYSNELSTIKLKDGQDIKQVVIVDNQNLVDDKVEQKFGNKIPPTEIAQNVPLQPQIPSDVNHLSGTIQQVAGSNGGSAHIDRSQVSEALPEISGVPQAPSVANNEIAAQQMVASLFQPDKQYPYHTVREASGIGYQVGNYGLNQFTVGNWLESFLSPDILAKLGHPPDWSKLAKLLRDDPELAKEFQAEMQKALIAKAQKLTDEANKNKLPPDDKLRLAANQLNVLAKNFANPKYSTGFVDLVSELSGKHEKITRAQIAQFMPKVLQDTVASYNVENFAKALGVTDLTKLSAKEAGEIGLAFYLGHIPTASELNNPSDSQYIVAGSNMYKLALAQLGSMGDITVTDAQGKIAVQAASDVGKSMWTHYLNNGNLGCAASVSEVLQSLGFSYANSALVYGLQHQLEAHGWKATSTPKPGDVVLGYRSSDVNGGGGAHCGIVGDGGVVYDNHSGSGKWSQDHLDYFSRNNFAAGVIFLEPPGNA